MERDRFLQSALTALLRCEQTTWISHMLEYAQL